MMLNINDKVFDAPRDHIVEALGLLPHWVEEYNMANTYSVFEEVGYPYRFDNLVNFMTDRYGFGDLYKFNGEVLADGSYRSPHEDDEDLPWVGMMKTRDGNVYFYQYAITALPTPNGYFITRMD